MTQPTPWIGAALCLSLLAGPLAAQSFLTGTDDSPGVPGHVKQFAGETLVLERSFFAYGSFSGGVRVASGDIDGDGTADIVTGAGTGGNGHVKVFSGADGSEIRSFFAYPGYTGGVYVAAGDINGDGNDDIITGISTSASHVKVFDGATGAPIRSFNAFGGFTGGVTVAAGDVDGDTFADIVVAAGPGAGPHVKVFSGVTSAEIRSFFAYDPAFSGGVFVASADFDGDSFSDIVTGAGSGSLSHVKAFSGATNAEIASFLAFGPSFTGGVRVAAGDIDGVAGPDLVAGTGDGAAAQVSAWSGLGPTLINNFLPYGGAYTDGVFVASTSAPAGPPPPPPPPPSVLEIPALGRLGLLALAALCAALALARLRAKAA